MAAPFNAVYERYLEAIGTVPKTVELFSASPAMFELETKVNRYFRDHSTLGFPLQCLIRYLTAADCDNGICVRLNEALLKRQGMSAEELLCLHDDPGTAPVTEPERRLLSFVVRAVAHPETTTAADIEALKQSGWTDADIFDAVYHGVMMVTSGLLTRIFKMAD